MSAHSSAKPRLPPRSLEMPIDSVPPAIATFRFAEPAFDNLGDVPRYSEIAREFLTKELSRAPGICPGGVFETDTI